jgi:glycosyltransferase involved in cell wall biosynthesis
MVATNPAYVSKAGGTKEARSKLISLFAHRNDVVFLNASGPKDKTSDASPLTYHFKQLFYLGICLALFSDFNIGIFLKIKEIIRKQKIDFICITEPYGIISTSVICPHTPVVYDAHDILSDHAELYFQRLKLDFRLVNIPLLNIVFRWILLRYLTLLERLACHQAKHIIAITESDKLGFINKYNVDENKITAMPLWIEPSNVTDISSGRKRTTPKDKINVVFHGTYRHPANYEAFKLIMDYIAPEIRKRNGNIEFILAGTDLPRFIKGNVRSMGYVQDLSELFEMCSIAIVPVLQATGVSVKTLDYIAAGLPVITTKQAATGIGLEHGKHAIVLDIIDESFIAAILNLASDKQQRDVLSKNALDLIKLEYNREKIQMKMDEMLIRIKAKTIL